jgi:hypothetical protein
MVIEFVACDSQTTGQECAMSETFLEEQLKRIRDLTEQVSRLKPLDDVHEVKNRSSEPAGRDRQSSSPSGRRDTAPASSRRRGR